MQFTTIIIGALLMAYGFYSYSIAEVKSLTALIPAYFGGGFMILGLIALKESLLKHAMHLAALLGVVGFLGGAGMGSPKLPKLFAGELNGPDLNKARSTNLLALICLVFLILCINSFIQARLRRKQAEQQSTQVPK